MATLKDGIPGPRQRAAAGTQLDKKIDNIERAVGEIKAEVHRIHQMLGWNQKKLREIGRARFGRPKM